MGKRKRARLVALPSGPSSTVKCGPGADSAYMFVTYSGDAPLRSRGFPVVVAFVFPTKLPDSRGSTRRSACSFQGCRSSDRCCGRVGGTQQPLRAKQPSTATGLGRSLRSSNCTSHAKRNGRRQILARRLESNSLGGLRGLCQRIVDSSRGDGL